MISQLRFKDPVDHTSGMEEQTRPEIVQKFQELEFLMKETMPMVKQHYEESGRPRTTKFNNYALPPEISEVFGPIGNEGVSLEETVETLKKVFKYSVNTMNPMYMDKLYPGTTPLGHVSEFVTTVLNTAAHVYVASPVFSVMEIEIVKVLAKVFGFPV